MSHPILEAIDLRKQFGPTVALAGVSFQVADGELFGLLGPNGAGKTTLLSIVAGLLEPSGGEARILGRKVQLSDRELRKHVGLVPQELAVYGELTARENLVFFGSLYGLGGADLERRAEEVLTAVGLHDRADGRVDTFSGGMKRRLNFGAALVHRPRLLLLDEATAGVDPQSRNLLFEEIRRLSAAGATVIYTSHYMEEVQSLCSRIGIIDHGRLIACDTLPALLHQLEGLIRFQVLKATPRLRERIEQLPGVRLAQRNGDQLELFCRDLPSSLIELVAVLKEMDIKLTRLETEEPNLERVFLHLTGRALRD
jgi:ABC-2 type transport system ATP-binding protein